MLESFALNGRVGDIGIKDKTIEVKLVFPNDERTQDELAFLFPIKKGLATIRILQAVNVAFSPGRRRAVHDEVGTPLLPGVDMSEICHACGRTVDCVNEPFFAKPIAGGKEIILCNACYMVPQPETIETPPNPEAEKEGDPDTAKCGDCLNFKPPEEGAEEGACAVHAGDPLGAYKKPGEIACEKFAAKPIPVPEEGEEGAPPASASGAEGAEEEQPQGAEPVKDTPPPPDSNVCYVCGHARGEKFIKDVGGRGVKVFWKTIENDKGVFEKCPSCGHLNQFPAEGGGDNGQATEGGAA